MSDWAQFKRLMELYSADPAVRELFMKYPWKVLEDQGFTLDPELAKEAIVMKYQWNPDPERVWANPYYSEYMRRNRKISEVVHQKSAKERFKERKMWTWNQTVTNRLRMENRELRMHPNIMYYPINFELGDGCRVQCSFCGLAAEKWKKNFLYTEENRKLWREVLTIAKDLIGDVVSTGICYYGTEPMDNPDYEKFLKDFAEITGDYPQTTTALADKYPERIRGLICQIGEERMTDAAMRFSVRTLEQFYRIMKEYTPEELSEIELLMNNPESDCCYSASGRIREHMEDYPEKKLNHRYSISCIAGFKVNMAKKTITFMEPEIPGEQFPNGIREYEVREFRDGEEFKALLVELGNKWVHEAMPTNLPLRWNPYIKVEKTGNTLCFEGDGIRCKLSGNHYFHESIEMIGQKRSFEEICKELKIGDFIAEELRQKLNILYHKGYMR